MNPCNIYCRYKSNYTKIKLDLLRNNFKFLIQEAEAIGIYNVVDYKKTPQNYCGTEIKSNPYFRE